MADISSYLAAIMAAVYGEDVRGSIHDAIEIINDVSEVVLNTGTAVTGPTSSSTGFFKDSFYINTTTMELWKCIGTDSWQSQGILKGADGSDGNGISSITKTATVGLVDTYTITYDDGGTETYQVTNGQNGSKWYKGTAISGTGTSITGFPGVLNDFYLNSVDGYVYTCTKTGGSLPPDAAEWDYVMTLTGGGGASITVVDNLTSTSTTDALSANQGRVLKGLVDNKADASSVPSDLDDLSDVTITSPSNNQVLKYNGSVWVNDTAPAGGHTMIPTPSSSPSEATVVSTINGKYNTANDDSVASVYGVSRWSNEKKIRKTMVGSTPIGSASISATGIGAWFDGDPSSITPSTDEVDWWEDAAFQIPNTDDVDVSIKFDPSTNEAIVLGGYILDTTTGRICIKFGNSITNTTDAKVAVDITYTRNEVD